MGLYVIVNMYLCPNERYLIVHNFLYWGFLNGMRILSIPAGIFCTMALILADVIHPIASIMFMLSLIPITCFWWGFEGLGVGFLTLFISFWFYLICTLTVSGTDHDIEEYVAKGHSNYLPTICLIMVLVAVSM